MTAKEVYQRFKNNQGLINHQLRVAAVAKTVCEHTRKEVDEQRIVVAALTHDLGNILKFQFDREDLAALVEPEGIAYWQDRQAEIELEYGTSPDDATLKMLKEIGLDPKVEQIIEGGHLENRDEIIANDDVASQILLYADMRVGPYAITTLNGRIDDIADRYAHRFTATEINDIRSKLVAIETALFANATLEPNQITEESTTELRRELLQWEIV